MPPEQQEQTLGLEQALAILRRRWPLIALCFVLVAGSAFFFSKQQTKRYTATASLVFNNNQTSQLVAGLPASAGIEPKAQQDTNVKLLEIGPTAAQTARRVGRGLTEKGVKEQVAITPEGESNVVDLEATSPSPSLAAVLANTYANEFVANQLQSNHRYFTSALALVEKQLGALSAQQRSGPQGLDLQNRAQSLAILAELQSGNVQLAQAASVPSAPSSPKTSRNTALGAILGLLLGVGLAFLIERLDRRIKDPSDLERIYALPLLGTVPESGAYRRHSPQQAGEAPAPLPPAEMEVFRMLRARLRYFNVDRDLRLVLVTSAASGDGKTTIVQDLAEAAASMGSRVLIVEADLRRPSIATRLGVRPAPGLTEVLISACEVEGAVQPVSGVGDELQAQGRAGEVSVLVAGTIAPNPAELVESKAIERVLEWAAGEYDLVLIDSPPLAVVPDAIPLLRKVDGVVIVSRLRKNTRDGAARLRDELSSLGAPMLGVVANGLKSRETAEYSYGYYHTSGTGGASRNGHAGTPGAAREHAAVGD